MYIRCRSSLFCLLFSRIEFFLLGLLPVLSNVKSVKLSLEETTLAAASVLFQFCPEAFGFECSVLFTLVVLFPNRPIELLDKSTFMAWTCS